MERGPRLGVVNGLELDPVEALASPRSQESVSIHAGLAKMGLVDPSLRKKEHGPQAAAKKARRLYNSVVHGVADQKAEQQETSNMTQSRAALNLTLNLIYVAATPSTRDHTASTPSS